MARTSHALTSRNTSNESPYGISSEIKAATRKTKDDVDANSKARFGEHRNQTGSFKRSINIECTL